MDEMCFMRDAVNYRVTCPMMICPKMQMQQMSANSPCMNYMYYNTPTGVDQFYRSNYCGEMCPEVGMQHVKNESLFQIEMRSVPLSEIED